MVFVDTSAFIAKYLSKDQYHQRAVRKWDEIGTTFNKCYTSNFVLDELFTLLGRWSSYDFAAAKAELIYTSDFFTILRPDVSDELAALQLFQKYADKKISFTDCVSFVLMKKNNIDQVFGYDKHFTAAGFKML